MTSTVKEPSELPGEQLLDQQGRAIGKIQSLYLDQDESEPIWLTVDARVGLFSHRTVFVPLARIKQESAGLLVPYDKAFVIDSPEVDTSEELSVQDEQALRDHYGIGRSDRELRDHNDSYAASVSAEADGAVREDAASS